MMPNVLLTGFEPFDQDPTNPSWEVARALDGWQPAVAGLAGDAFTVRAAQLPCVFGDAVVRLQAAIAQWQPVLVICLGLAGGRSEITPERVAINVDDARIPDNAGRQPVDTAVQLHGPVAYFSTLPIKAMVRSLRAEGIPASVSNTAGTFVCNHVFYALMHHLAQGTTTKAARRPARRVEGSSMCLRFPSWPRATRVCQAWHWPRRCAGCRWPLKRRCPWWTMCAKWAAPCIESLPPPGAFEQVLSPGGALVGARLFGLTAV